MELEKEVEENIRDAEAKRGDPHDVPARKRVKSGTKSTEIECLKSDMDS